MKGNHEEAHEESCYHPSGSRYHQASAVASVSPWLDSVAQSQREVEWRRTDGLLDGIDAHVHGAELPRRIARDRSLSGSWQPGQDDECRCSHCADCIQS